VVETVSGALLEALLGGVQLTNIITDSALSPIKSSPDATSRIRASRLSRFFLFLNGSGHTTREFWAE
jgi:hypothetical protein